MESENDHVQWLRKQARAARTRGEKAGDEKAGEKLLRTAARLFAAADALETALAGLDPASGAGPGSRAIGAALAPGSRVRVMLASGQAPLLLEGTMEGMSRYQFFFETHDGRRLVVQKHAVVYYELEPQAISDQPPLRERPNHTEIREG